MIAWGSVIVAAALLVAPSNGFAQDDDDIDELLGVEETPAPAETEEDLPEIGESDQLAVFVLDRGIYMSSDVGVFVTVGGQNGYSNLQPYLALKAGIDLGDMFSVQLAISTAYVSQNPVTEFDIPGNTLGRQIANFDMLNIGFEGVIAFRPTSRFAIEPRVGGGLTRLAPELTDPNAPSRVDGMSPWTAHAVGGVDFKYLTLLTDFTAGVSTNVHLVFGPEPIIGISGAFLVRYTFS